MIGQLYIDGRDAYTEFGVFVTKGGYDDLLTAPKLKKVESIDWKEEDGEQVDLSAPVLDSRDLVIRFAAHGAQYKIGALIELLSDKAYHGFEFRELGRTYKLRLVSQSDLKMASYLGTFALRFADDFPLDGYTYKAPQSSIVTQRGYEIDGVSLSKYGVYVLEGCREEIEKSPAVKKNLLRNINSQKGAIYDEGVVVYATKEVKMNCLMRASSISEFWRNYDALLYDLTRPGERRLFVEQTGGEYPCYYKGCSSSKFVPTEKIWFEFSLELVFTSFRVAAEEFVLGSDAEELIVTEDGIYAINLEQ